MEPSVAEAKEHFRVQLESFEGPLDLLLALVQKHEMDIFSLSLATITEDYLAYLGLLQQLDLDLTGDYLAVAATLVLMKSRALLPTETEEEELEEDDPQLLLHRLEEYKRFQAAADILRTQEIQYREIYYRRTEASRELGETVEFYDLNVYDLFSAFKKILSEIGDEDRGVIRDEDWTVDEKMVELEELLQETPRANLSDYLRLMRAKLEVIVSFLALLELIRRRRLLARQAGPQGDIWIMRPEGSQAPSAADDEDESASAGDNFDEERGENEHG